MAPSKPFRTAAALGAPVQTPEGLEVGEARLFETLALSGEMRSLLGRTVVSLESAVVSRAALDR